MILERRRSLIEKKLDSRFICTISITSNNYLLQLPFSGNINIEVKWGDGVEEGFSGNISNPSHTYTTSGQYTIIVDGTVEIMNSNGLTNSWQKNLISIDQWGDLELINMNRACYNCSNLVSIAAPLGNPNISDVSSMFERCVSLTIIPEHLFDDNTLVSSFNYTFNGCTKLTSIPSGLFDNNQLVMAFYNTFSNCSPLTSIPSGLFDNNKSVTHFHSTFNGCNNLIEIPDHLFNNNTAVTSFEWTFYNCTSLTSIPEYLFDNNKSVTIFRNTFAGCTGLSGETPNGSDNIELWDRAGKTGYPNSISGTQCFTNCAGLSNYSDIPAGWK